MSRVRTGQVVVGVAAVVAALAGCAPESPPAASGANPTRSSTGASASPSASSTASESPTRSPSGPAVPEAAQKKTDAGAEAFVRYFFDQVNHAWMTADPSPLPGLSADVCQFCRAMTSRARALAKADQRYESEPITLGAMRALEGEPEGDAYFRVDLQQNSVRVLDKQKHVVRTDKARRGWLKAGVRWKGGQWQFLDLEQLDG